MKVFVLADEGRKEELLLKKAAADTQFIFAENFSALTETGSADAFFILTKDIDLERCKAFTQKPVFLDASTATLKKLQLPGNFSRIIGWPTFLKREIWEVATENEVMVKNIFDGLQWKYLIVEDVPGLVSARVISMIINEAYFALGDNVSSREEIDLAMKLGTNYPFGPFEWSKKIGLENVYTLLQNLAATDGRYAIAPLMKNEILKY
jgi:3-hydroxybutyryl-CoA dehydrogenase